MPVGLHIFALGSRLSTRLEASALPASSVPLPASSPRAFAGAEAALAWSRPEAACAAAVAGAPAVAFVEPELVGFGSARDDCLVVPPADDSFRGDCSAALESADFPAGFPVG